MLAPQPRDMVTWFHPPEKYVVSSLTFYLTPIPASQNHGFTNLERKNNSRGVPPYTHRIFRLRILKGQWLESRKVSGFNTITKLWCAMRGKEIAWAIRSYLHIVRDKTQQDMCHWSLGWRFCLTLPHIHELGSFPSLVGIRLRAFGGQPPSELYCIF